MATARPSAVDCQAGSSGRQVLEDHFDLIQSTIRSVAWMGRLQPDERGDFESYTWVKLLDDDARRLGSYLGKCPLPAFLRVVLKRILLDYRTSRWGKWRPSADAKRAGAKAVEAERRVVRDGYPIHAVAGPGSCDERRLLRRWHGSSLTHARSRVREESLDATIDRLAASGPSPEEILLARARDARSLGVGEALQAAMGALSAEERQLLALRYEKGHAVSHIAASMGRDQKRLYRFYERLCDRLRRDIERRGIALSDVRETIMVA